MKKLTPERKLQRVKINLMRAEEFALWAGIMMIGKTSLSDDVPTANTDGVNEVYGRAFVDELEEKQLGFVVLHENLHKALRHLTIWPALFKENPMLANAAMDFVINNMLVEMDPSERVIAFPQKDGERFGLYDEQYKNMTTKQVFDLLKKKYPPQGGKGGKGKPGDESGDGSGSGDGPGSGFDEHDWEGAQELSDEQKEEISREIDQAMRQGQIAHEKIHGKGSLTGSREIEDLLHPQAPWEDLLKEFVSATCTAKDTSSWRRVNRRFLCEDIYLPSLIGERVEHLVIGIDTSGSIGQTELTKFLTEIKAICDTVHPQKIDLMYWDTEVAGHEVYDYSDGDSLIQSTKPRGGGGTDPTCMQRYLEKEKIVPEAIVMLTDGYVGSWGDWNVPILWVISEGNENITAPCGKTIHIR